MVPQPISRPSRTKSDHAKRQPIRRPPYRTSGDPLLASNVPSPRVSWRRSGAAWFHASRAIRARIGVWRHRDPPCAATAADAERARTPGGALVRAASFTGASKQRSRSRGQRSATARTDGDGRPPRGDPPRPNEWNTTCLWTLVVTLTMAEFTATPCENWRYECR
jgi:hypothetical protein